MSSRLPFRSRVLTALGAALLVGVFIFPIWRIDLEAPQYPEGIGMLIHVNAVGGVKPNDLNNINGLNHYIGMKAIEPESIPELTYMPWIVGTLLVSGLLVALWGRRAALVGWVSLFMVVGVLGIVDFWLWGYDYGHNLDPQAIIKIPDMVYQPPLIGSKQLLNFTAHSWPDIGGMMAAASFLLGAIALYLAYRKPAEPRPARAAAAERALRPQVAG